MQLFYSIMYYSYTNSKIMHTWTYTHNINIFTSIGIPMWELLCTQFNAALNYWLVVFLVLWEATSYEQEDRSPHKNCSRTLSFSLGIIDPQPPSETGHSLFLAPSHLVTYSCCVLSLSLICLIYSHTPPPSQTSLVQGAFIKEDCRLCSYI